MLRSRFLWQLCGAIAAIILVSTLVFSFVASNQVQRDARDNIRESLHVQATLLSHLLMPALKRGSTLSIAQVDAIAGDTRSRITAIDPAGRVLADNREEAVRMDNHGNRPEILEARKSGVGVSERFSHTIRQNMLYVAVKVENDGAHMGYLRVALPLETVDDQLHALRNKIFVSGAIIAGVFLLVGFLLARQFTLPVSRMTEGATRIARGDYDLRLPEDRRDEIGDLSVALNELARDTKRRIDDLTSSRNQLAAILSGLTEGVIAVDLDQRIVHINDSATRMLRVSGRDAVGSPLWEVVSANEIRQAIDTCLSQLITVNATVKVDDKTLDLSVLLLRSDDWRSATGAIVVLQDVTEMLRLEQVRTDFVANASHELKTPISAIRGMVETILDDPEMTEDVRRQFIERINAQASRLDNIVQDLIHLSRFDTHARKMSVSTLDLGFLIRQVYSSCKEDARAKGIELGIDVPDRTIEVEGEQEALGQMLSNLIDNAIKYSRENGRVEVRLRTLGRMAVIEVEDDGIGIADDEQQRIFERFYRVDRARSREQGGTGLGLAIVKHIAQGHEGSVAVTSRLHEGSVFSVRLPLANS